MGFRVLSVIGSFAGLAIALFGLGIGRKARSLRAIDSEPTTPGRIIEPGAVERLTAPQVIRISTEPGTIRSSEMTHQQRIAAALGRAGISGPAWDDADRQHATTAVMEHPAAAPQETHPAVSEDAAADIHPGVRKVTLLAGLMLLVGSILLLMATR